MHQNAGNMFQNFLGKLNTLYSKRAGKIISFLYKNDNFLKKFWKHLIKIYTPTRTKLHHFKNFLVGSVQTCNVCTFIAFKKKITIQKGPLFPIFKRSSSIHKNNPALVASIVSKKIYFHGICALSKKYI